MLLAFGVICMTLGLLMVAGTSFTISNWIYQSNNWESIIEATDEPFSFEHALRFFWWAYMPSVLIFFLGFSLLMAKEAA